MSRITADRVVIVGGGPAGLAAAIALRHHGLSVTVLDAQQPPIDKACGEGILPSGVHTLQRLGVQFHAHEAFPLKGLKFIRKHTSVAAPFSSSTGLGIRRVTLQQKLAESAAQLGAELHWNTSVTALESNAVLANHKNFSCDWIIAADGSQSRIRFWSNISSTVSTRRFAFRRHFHCAPWSDHVEIYWGNNFQVFVTPTGRKQLGVAVISSDAGLRTESAIRHIPELAVRLARAIPSSAERGSWTGIMRPAKVVQRNVALIGDAAGTVDAITGEGLSMAFEQAEFLAGAIATQNLPAYQQFCDRLRRKPAWMSRILVAMDGRPRLQSRVLQTLSRKPEMFQQLIAAHTGSVTPVNLATTAAAFGWSLLAL